MGLSEFQSPSQKPGSAACTTLPGLGRLKSASTGEKIVFLNNLTTEVGGFRYSRGFSPRGCPRFAVTPTTKSLLTQPLYGKGRNPPPSEPPELALGDPFSGLNDYDTGVKPGCYSSWNGLTDPFRGVGNKMVSSRRGIKHRRPSMQNLTKTQKKKHSLFSLASGLGAHASTSASKCH